MRLKSENLVFVYGQATRAFIDYEDYTMEECIFYYQILEKVVGVPELQHSNYLIAGLKSIMSSPEFLHKTLFETRFAVENEMTVSELSRKLKISKQGLLNRFEDGYNFIKRQDDKYDIAKRIALLNRSIVQLQNARDTHSKQYASKGLSIETLPLKQRTYTCMERAGVKTIAQFMALKETEIRNIPGAGEKTIEDILTNQAKLVAKFNNCTYQDVGIYLEKLGLGVRAMHTIRRLGIKTIEEFASLTRKQVLNVCNAGEKTWQEIYEKQQSLKYGNI